jgi:coenzyme F420-reducing hydrogenase alpha subunit
VWTHSLGIRAPALDDEALRLRCEQAIRNHDPCISCSTHFLDLTVDRA